MKKEQNRITPKELATKAVMHALMKAGIKVHLATPEMFAKDMSEHRSNIELQMGNKQIRYVKNISSDLKKWAKDLDFKKNMSFTLRIPDKINGRVSELLGKKVSKYKIQSTSFKHIFDRHGINGEANNEHSIPIRPEDLSLIPYILTAPDRVYKGSTDKFGNESIRFEKQLQNGYVLVVEKENLKIQKENSPIAMETITMWAESSSNVMDVHQGCPPCITSKTVVIGSNDIAKIIKDAEKAIREDVKNQIDKQINYFYALDCDNIAMAVDDILGDVVVPCRKNGTLYGWTFNGNIYLTPEGINPETPVHEYTHLWANAMMIRNPERWQEIKNLLSDSLEWQSVVNDPSYHSISDDEDRIASETLARLGGRSDRDLLVHNAECALKGAHAEDERSLIRKVLDSTLMGLKKFWGWVGKTLFPDRTFKSMRQVTDRVLYDLLKGYPLERPVKEIESMIEESVKEKPLINLEDRSILDRNPFEHSKPAINITNPFIIKQGIGYAIRCDVNGKEQGTEKLSPSEQNQYERLKESGNKDKLDKLISEIAENHFIQKMTTGETRNRTVRR